MMASVNHAGQFSWLRDPRQAAQWWARHWLNHRRRQRPLSS